MRDIILYLIIFLLTYLFYIIFVINRKNVLEKFPKGKEMSYLRLKYNININSKNLKSIAYIIALSNSFILSSTVYIISFFDNMFIEVLVGLVTLIVLILLVYHIIGKFYQRKQNGGNKNV